MKKIPKTLVALGFCEMAQKKRQKRKKQAKNGAKAYGCRQKCKWHKKKQQKLNFVRFLLQKNGKKPKTLDMTGFFGLKIWNIWRRTLPLCG